MIKQIHSIAALRKALQCYYNTLRADNAAHMFDLNVIMGKKQTDLIQ